MTLEPRLWLHCSISGRCLLEYIIGTQSQWLWRVGTGMWERRWWRVDSGMGEKVVVKAHRLLYHSTLGLRVIKKKKEGCGGLALGCE